MEIYLMQHGANVSKDEDLQEGLSPQGEADVLAGGRALKKMGVSFDAILASPKKRSRQTASIVARETGFDVGKIIESEKVKAMTPPEETIGLLAELPGTRRILVAGHLPSVGEVASFLLTAGPKIAVQFERGSVCRIDVESVASHSGRLRWFLLPDQLKRIAG